MYLVPSLSLKQNVLKSAYDSPLVGHPSFFKTYRRLRERFSWKGFKNDFLKYVNEFPTCQQNKVHHNHLHGLVHPFPTLEHKWESISMDFITGLPKVLDKYCIFAIVDRLTKFAHFFVVTTNFTTAQVVELFFK